MIFMKRGGKMRIIYVSNYSRKIFLILAILLIWLSMFFTADQLIKNNLLYSITIENCMEFSYPYGIVVDNVLINDKADEKVIQANHTFSAQAREFSNYKSLEGNFSFDYPTAFVLKPQQFSGSDILYHIDFRNKADTVHGFVQVWKMPGNLEDFLKNAKAASQQKYKYFRSSSIKVNGLPGFYWDYIVIADDRNIKASEVFLQEGDLMYRISYFVPENEWNESQSNLFWNMVKSFKTY